MTGIEEKCDQTSENLGKFLQSAHVVKFPRFGLLDETTFQTKGDVPIDVWGFLTLYCL